MITSGNIILPKYSSGYIVFPEANAKAFQKILIE